MALPLGRPLASTRRGSAIVVAGFASAVILISLPGPNSGSTANRTFLDGEVPRSLGAKSGSAIWRKMALPALGTIGSMFSR